ncbi:Disintegrin and metalloproteinase domain-containing protein 12 [Lonchura striata]|uniref:Disintegrin and metalloproteinase domain-containing protein 12 n=1 Tax=Lonchura striata TaxID=40157 RepID=A0A218UU31_9PASE|nr:Disintegrin and metalloproteinase domain-containing protein 12 [Lonchura striata domestica]
MSKRLQAAQPRSPRALPPARLPALLLLLLGPARLLSASPRARGENVDSQVESPRLQVSKDQPKDYEITIPFLLNGEQWRPVNGIYSKNHPAVLQFVIQAENKHLVINLERNEGLLARGFTETHYLQDGTDVVLTHNHTGHCFYHGQVQGFPGSSVSLSTCSGLRGIIVFENNSYILEPLEGATSEHKIYRAENLRIAPGSCGHQLDIPATGAAASATPQHSPAARYKRETLKTTKYVELVIVADNREFQRQGKDVEKIKQRLIEIANYVDKFYRPLNIRVALVGVEVWNDMDKCSISQDPFTSLHEFLDWRKLRLLPRKAHDNAQLISYPFPMVFSSCSRKDLENSLEKGVGMCLFNLPEVKESFGGQKCGNGYVEDGEECDCGEPEECTNRCCNATTCALKPGAVCAHGLCCQDCQLKPAGISCRESSNSCDLPEFCTGASPQCPANVYLHDGHACHGVDGYCYNGICQTHEQQCITLWGPGAKPAPGICFERVNSAGDPYGNCGKDSKSSFAKCEPRDAKCGKIQCQGGANRPVIGTNAVSIETNIPLQEGGKILCRGTHVYLGDDMPDPGLVLAGTKCEDGKICLNRRCQNTSVFGVHKCATKCHGRGVCNNKKNCHCEADWAPPFCDKPGFGGSVDSGPIRQADNKSLTIGVLITILCLIFAGSIMYLKRKTFMRWLFTSKKTTIEKLRSVSPARPSSSSEPNHVHTICVSKNLITKPQNTAIQKRDSPRRPLPYQIIDISNPVKTHEVPPLKTPQRVLPPLPQLPGHQAGPERPLPANPSLRFSQEPPKPSAPRKPLPADPLGRARHGPAGHPKALPHASPARPAPRHPSQVSRSSSTMDVK